MDKFRVVFHKTSRVVAHVEAEDYLAVDEAARAEAPDIDEFAWCIEEGQWDVEIEALAKDAVAETVVHEGRLANRIDAEGDTDG